MAIQQSPSAGLRELALFAGAGGGILGGQLLGWRTVCAVENDAYAASVLAQRQNDGLLPPFPIWDDVCTFDGNPWRGRVDVISGGFPCQDISAAGRGEGITGARSGLWSEFARIIGEVRPRFAFVENSPILTSRGLGTVLGDLAALGFDARWGVLGANAVGAPHKRDRIWIVAKILRPCRCGEVMADAAGPRSFPTAQAGIHSQEESRGPRDEQPERHSCSQHPWATEPDVGRVADGVAARVDRLTAIGNGQVPQCAAAAWRLLNDC